MKRENKPLRHCPLPPRRPSPAVSISVISMENLPVEVMVDILSRLPVKTIIHCKCLCKKWLNLISDSYFSTLHLTRSPTGFMIHHTSEKETKLTGPHKPGILKWVEIKDELNYQDLVHDPVMSLDLNVSPIFQNSRVCPVGSVNGLICIWQYGRKIDNYFICNPITREYMILPTQKYCKGFYAVIDHGFGVGSLTHEYKVVRVIQRNMPSNPDLSEAEVYTLGTGQWRSLGHFPYRNTGGNGPYLNGHAHWSISRLDTHNTPEKIYAFDFDNETFKLFPSPPVEFIHGSSVSFKSLGVLKGCLCECDGFDTQFTIWVMKEYGVKESWHREVIIKEGTNVDWLMWEPVYLIERLRDGTIVMVNDDSELLEYSKEKRMIVDTGFFYPCFTGLTYCPSFLKLRNFESERVHVF